MIATFQQLLKEKPAHNKYKFQKGLDSDITGRVVSAVAGGFLIYNGFQGIFKAPISSAAKVLAGSLLFYQGATGDSAISRRTSSGRKKDHNVNIKTYLDVNRPKEEVYQFWRQLENLPLFMQHLESVKQIDDKYSHWKAKIPGNFGTISWTAEIVEDKDYFIGWQSVEGSAIYNAGKVEFRDSPDGQGTQIQAVISYKAPAGGLGTSIAELLNPIFENMVREDILNFKNYLETNEIPSVEA